MTAFSLSAQQALLIFLLNAALVVVVSRGIARSAASNGHARTRIAVFAVLLFGDACLLLWLYCHLVTLVYIAVVLCGACVGIPGNPTGELSRRFGRWKFGVFILSVGTTACLVCVHLPIMTFLTSPGEIGTHLDYLIRNNARNAMVVVYLASALYAFAFSPRMRSVLTVVSLTSLIVAVLYSFLLPLGYPVMNGLMFEQIPIPTGELATRAIVDVAAIVLSTFLALFALARFGSKKILVGILLVNMSLVVVSGIKVARDTVSEGKHNGGMSAIEKPLRFAEDKGNVLVILLDRFMGGFVEKIFDDEPDVASRFEGFTWYPRTISAGDNSIAGVHPIFGGYDYTPREMNARDRVLRDLSVEAFKILPHNFTSAGYEVNFVNPRGLGFTMAGDCSYLEMQGMNCTHIPATVTKLMAEEYGVPTTSLTDSGYADLLVLLGLMRGAPYVMKGVLSERGPWKPFLDHSAGTTFTQWAELKSLPQISTTTATESNLNVVWNLLPHEPYFMGEDCIPMPARFEVSREVFEERGYSSLFEMQHAITARCALTLVADYLEWMKTAGIYDNTKIVVVSDHGIVGPVEDRSSRAEMGGTTDPFFVRTRSVLFVKEREAHGSLRVSETFTPNAEVPRILCEEIGGCVNPFLKNKTIEAHGRDQPFYVAFVPWQFNQQERNAFVIREEFAVRNRDPFDVGGWTREGPR